MENYIYHGYICFDSSALWTLYFTMILSFFSFVQTAAAAAAKSLQSCPTLCDPRDGSPPGSPVPGFLQARTLEWVAISFSRLVSGNLGRWVWHVYLGYIRFSEKLVRVLN